MQRPAAGVCGKANHRRAGPCRPRAGEGRRRRGPGWLGSFPLQSDPAEERSTQVPFPMGPRRKNNDDRRTQAWRTPGARRLITAFSSGQKRRGCLQAGSRTVILSRKRGKAVMPPPRSGKHSVARQAGPLANGVCTWAGPHGKGNPPSWADCQRPGITWALYPASAMAASIFCEGT
jgi:hypothetical protein